MITTQLPAYSFDKIEVVKTSMGLIHKFAWWSILVFIFLLPWGNGLWDGIAKVFGLLAFAFSTLLLITQGTHRNFNLFNLMSLVFGYWYLIALVWTPDQSYGIEEVNKMAQLVLFSVVYTFVINDAYKLRWAYLGYVLGSMVAFGIIFSNFLRGVYGPYYGRYTVPNIETDNMAIILSLGIPMAVWLYTQFDKKIAKLLCLMCVPVLFYGIFLTGTRTGLVAGVVGLLYLFFTQRKAPFSLKLIYIGVFIFLVVMVISLAPKASVERIFSIGAAIETGDLNSREVIWQYSLESWREHPVLGGGSGSLFYMLNRFHVNFHSAHNAYIHILAEHGLIGLVIYILMFASMLFYILKCPTNTKVFLLALFVTVAVSQLSLHSQTLKEIWFVWSIIAIHGYLVVRMKERVLGR